MKYFAVQFRIPNVIRGSGGRHVVILTPWMSNRPCLLFSLFTLRWIDTRIKSLALKLASCEHQLHSPTVVTPEKRTDRSPFVMSTNDLNAVAIKLPTFWTAQPVVWFAQAEAQFNIKNITQDSTKYYYVVSALDQATASRIINELSHPPETGKYENLKKKLLGTFDLTRRERASRLLHLGDIGDRKPSELMDEILSLLDGHKPCLLAEQVFLEHLPEDIRMQIADEDFEQPQALAIKADNLWLAKQQSTMQVINKVTSSETESRKVRPTSHRDWCFYHAKFGEKARRCRSPCKYPGNEGAGRQGH